MIAILQPHIPHYREAFLKGIQYHLKIDIFCFEDIGHTQKNNFKSAKINTVSIKSFNIKSLIFYSPLKLLNSKYSTLVLMLSITHISTWMILVLNKVVFKKKIILWGHGISINQYEKEAENPNIFRKWMIKLADEIWFYTEREKIIWQKELPNLKAISLNNTLSKVDEILDSRYTNDNVETLREKYAIKTPFVLIYCARFNEIGRRADLLHDIISKCDSLKYTFVIIGSGKYKPDFSTLHNVLDFGELYDEVMKQELFSLSDLYIQPGWLGLSIVEAMANSLGILSFERSKSISQCVEYGYVIDGYNGKLVGSVSEAIEFLNSVDKKQLQELGNNARNYAQSNLLMRDMISNAVSSLSI